jgi:cell division protein FtsA
MEGMTEFAEEILGMPVRLGVPVGVRGITQLVAGPQFATGVGLVQYGAHALTQARDRDRSAAEIVREGRAAKMSSREKAAAAAISELEFEKDKRTQGGFWNWIRAAF